MSVIVAVAYQRLKALPRWQQFHLHGRVLPTHLLSALLPSFRRWTNYVRPILSNGNLVGLWVSNRMSARRWRHLRAIAEPLLTSSSEAPASREIPEADHADESPQILSLSKCHLYIPQENLDRAQYTLARFGDIEIQTDEDGDGDALVVPRHTSLQGVLEALSVDAEPIEPVSSSKRLHLFGLLRAEIRKLDPTVGVHPA